MEREEREKAHALAERAWEEVLRTCVSVQMAVPEDARFELFTDWSTEALGYVLFVDGEGGRQIVDINSAKTADQATVSSFLGELRGIVWGLKKVRHIVWTAPIKVCCDNQGTVSRLRKGETMGDDVRCSRLMSWILENFPQACWEYVPGAINQVADFLSRKRAQEDRGERVVGMLSLSQRPPEDVVRQRLEKAHRGHWHAERTWQHLKRDGPIWPGARREALHYAKRCPTCQRFRSLEHREPWEGMEMTRPNEVVFGDFLGPIRLSRGRGKRVILVLVDGFSRYTHLHMAVTPTETAVLRGLRRWERTLTWRHGHVRLFMADRGAAFLEQNKLPADLQIQARISVEGKGDRTSVQVAKEKMESPMFKDSFQKWEEQDFKDKVKEAKTKPEKAEVHSGAHATLITISIAHAGGYWSIGTGSGRTSHKADGYR